MSNTFSLEVCAQPKDLIFLLRPAHLLLPAALWPSSEEGTQTNQVGLSPAPFVHARAPENLHAGGVVTMRLDERRYC